MEKKLTISLSGRRYEALAYQMKQKNETVEQALELALLQLYEKQVPKILRDYVEDQISGDQMVAKGGKDRG